MFVFLPLLLEMQVLEPLFCSFFFMNHLFYISWKSIGKVTVLTFVGISYFVICFCPFVFRIISFITSKKFNHYFFQYCLPAIPHGISLWNASWMYLIYIPCVLTSLSYFLSLCATVWVIFYFF